MHKIVLISRDMNIEFNREFFLSFYRIFSVILTQSALDSENNY